MIQTFHSLNSLAIFAKQARGNIITQVELAKKSGWSQANVGKLETIGYGVGEVSLKSAKEIFEALGYKMIITLEQ